MPNIEIINVTKKYGRIAANDHISLSIVDGEYVSILGPSGCGKTTLIKCVAGIIQPDEGEIYIAGKLVNHVPMEDRGIGYVFQNIALFPHMDVWNNITYSPKVRGTPLEQIRPLALEMLEIIKLGVRSDAFPSELSSGMQQKTAVARALISRAELLLFDEPLGSLDTKVRAMLRHELRRLVKDLGLTAMHVTHDQEEAMAISDRIVVMKRGELIEVGTPMELYLQPKRLFTANFVGEANFLTGELIRSTPEGSVVTVNGKILRSARKISPERKEVVAAIRPEYAALKSGTKDAWAGTVENRVSAGSLVRYEIRMTTGELIAVKHHSTADREFDLGEKVILSFPPQYVLLYPYPEEGLEKEISIE